jgi:hypothetical protein
MNPRWITPALAFIAPAILFGIVFTGCRETEVSAVRLETPIAIDGARSDWEGINGYDFESQKFYLGVANDDGSLYLLVATNNRALAMEALRCGLRFRFKPERAKRSTLWIGSPGPVRDGIAGLEPPPEGLRPGESGGRARPMEDFTRNTDERLQAALAELRDEVRIFTAAGEDSVDLLPSEAAERGLEMRAGYEKGGHFILEMKVPLTRADERPLAIGVPSGGAELINLDLSIPKPQWGGPGFEDGRHDGTGFGREPQPGRAFPGGDGGGMGPRAQAMNLQGLDVTVKIALAAGEAPMIP